MGDDPSPALLNAVIRDTAVNCHNTHYFSAPHSSEKQLPDEESAVQAIDLKQLSDVEWETDESMEPRVAWDSIGLGNFSIRGTSAVPEHSHGTRKMPNERRRSASSGCAGHVWSRQPDPVLVRFIHIGSRLDTDNWVSISFVRRWSS